VDSTIPTKSSVNIKTPMVKEPMVREPKDSVIEPGGSVEPEDEYDREIFQVPTAKQMRESQTVNPVNASTETRKMEPRKLQQCEQCAKDVHFAEQAIRSPTYHEPFPFKFENRIFQQSHKDASDNPDRCCKVTRLREP
jgi:hypothetical protein